MVDSRSNLYQHLLANNYKSESMRIVMSRLLLTTESRLSPFAISVLTVLFPVPIRLVEHVKRKSIIWSRKRSCSMMLSKKPTTIDLYTLLLLLPTALKIFCNVLLHYVLHPIFDLPRHPARHPASKKPLRKREVSINPHHPSLTLSIREKK